MMKRGSYKAEIKVSGAVFRSLFGQKYESLKAKALAQLTGRKPGWAGTWPEKVILSQHLHRLKCNRSAWKELEVIHLKDIPLEQHEWRKKLAQIQVPYTTRSICPCGFGVLNDDIPLGTLYTVIPHDVDWFTYQCGRCKVNHRIKGIFVLPREGAGAGYMPIGLFQMPYEEAKEEEHEAKA